MAPVKPADYIHRLRTGDSNASHGFDGNCVQRAYKCALAGRWKRSLRSAGPSKWAGEPSKHLLLTLEIPQQEAT
jgi:hypothetical protein